MKNFGLGAGVAAAVIYAVTKLAGDTAGKISWRFKGISFDGLGGGEEDDSFWDKLTTLRVAITLEVINQTGLGIGIEKFEGEVTFKGTHLTDVLSAGQAFIAPHATTNVRYLVPIKPSAFKAIFGKTLKDALKNFADSVKPGNYRLTGAVSLRKGPVIKEIKIDEPFVYS